VRHPCRGRLVLAWALILLTLAAAAGCGNPPPSAQWANGPAATGSGDDGGPSGGAAATGSPGGPGDASFQGRLPVFPPPPTPQPITAPTGPYAPIYKRLPISQPVAFLTMDDGFTQLPIADDLMRAAHIPFTMFLIGPVAARSPEFFKRLEADGGVVEDHTITHPEMRGKPYAFQQREVCGARALLQQTFGTTLSYFRPPFGDYDQTTLRAVHDCGLRAAFYWSETVNNGTVFYQTAEHKIHPGDIILMHFRPRFVDDVIAALTAIHQAGLTPALLENYVT
jgi:peptidoglycan/xylan/chitin deacetylase (PgdA/CDA1 family)